MVLDRTLAALRVAARAMRVITAQGTISPTHAMLEPSIPTLEVARSAGASGALLELTTRSLEALR